MTNHDPKNDADDEALDRQAILARRSRFVAAALAGLAGASLVAACGGNVKDDEDAGNPSPCLSPAVTPDAAPWPCLEPPLDRDGSADGGDATPQPCLSRLPPDAGDDAGDAGPQPCLAPPPG